MRRPLALALALALSLTLSACASSGLASRAAVLNAPVTATRSSYVIGAESFSSDRSLLDVVAARWPQLVRGDLPRGELSRFASPDRFGVYDARGAFLGGPSALESLRGRDVLQLRRLTYVEEVSRFGKGHPAGAVIVTWRQDPMRP